MTLYSQHIVPLSEPVMRDSSTPSASTGKTAFIEARNLWQEYGDLVVLERLNLKVNEGEFCTLVGASGCRTQPQGQRG